MPGTCCRAERDGMVMKSKGERPASQAEPFLAFCLGCLCCGMSFGSIFLILAAFS